MVSRDLLQFYILGINLVMYMGNLGIMFKILPFDFQVHARVGSFMPVREFARYRD